MTLEEIFRFFETPERKIKVHQSCTDYEKRNARFQTEKGVKMVLAKEFGIFG